MGKAARTACIFVPMCLSVVTLVFLALVGLGQTNSGSTYLSNLYFMKANTEYNRNSISNVLTGHKATNETDKDDKTSSGDIIIYKYYTIGLWNYCAGNDSNDGSYKVAFCTDRQTHFVFNPEEVWGIDKTVTTKFFSSSLNGWLDKYTGALGQSIGPLYIIAVIATAVEVLVGFAAIFSRIGSCATIAVASVAGLFSFAFAVMTTASYFALSKAFNAALEKDGVQLTTGPHMYLYVWLVVVFQAIATFCWSFTACCVSGRSSDRKNKGIRMVDSPFHSGGGAGGYQKMEGGEVGHSLMGHSAPMGGGSYEHAPYGAPPATAYEPFRHH